MNYEQLTSLFRVEERSVAVRDREPRERPDHGRRDGRCSSSCFDKGADRRGRRQLHRHALRLRRPARLPPLPARARSSTAQPAPRDEPLRDAARPVRARALGDQLHRPALHRATTRARAEVGVYSVAVRIASAIVFLMIAFRLAWPAFAYSITDDRDAKRTYAFVLTYVLLVTCWISLALGAARAVARATCWRRNPGFAARRRGGRAALPSPPPPTPATPCSRSASGARGRRSSTGSITGLAAAVNIGAQRAPDPAATG